MTLFLGVCVCMMCVCVGGRTRGLALTIVTNVAANFTFYVCIVLRQTLASKANTHIMMSYMNV